MEEKMIFVNFTGCLYTKTFEDVREIRYYIKYNKLLIVYEDMSCKLISDVEGFMTGTMVKYIVITD